MFTVYSMEIVEGNRKFSKVLIDNLYYTYSFGKKRKIEDSFNVRCSIKSCSGSGIFTQNNLKILSKHNHEPDPSTVFELKFLKTIKSRAEKEKTSLSLIYQEEMKKEMYSGCLLPSYRKIKSTLQKRRKLAQTAKDIQVPSSPLATHIISNKGMEIIEGPKRYSKIYIDEHGYSYRINRKKSNNILILRCHEDGCKGSGLFEPNYSSFTSLVKHSHFADPLQVNRWRFLSRCKQRVETETTSLRTIYDEESEKVQQSDLPPFKKIESTLLKRRQKSCPLVNYSNDVWVLKSSNSKKQLPSNEIDEFSSIIQNYAVNKKMKMDSTHAEECSFNNHSIPIKKETENFKLNSEELRSLKQISRISYYKSDMEVIEGKKRYSLNYIDAELFVYQKSKDRHNGSLLLKCKESSCAGSGIFNIYENPSFHRKNEHNHEPNQNYVNRCKVLNTMKIRAETENLNFRTIYDEEIAKFPNISFKKFSKVESTLQKRRQSQKPQEPNSIEEALQIFTKSTFLKQLSSEKNFCKAFLRNEQHSISIVIFASLLLSDDEEMPECFFDRLHFDSSFPLFPSSMFNKLVLISVVSEDEQITPIFYILMNSFNSTSLNILCEYLELKFIKMKPKMITTDFKQDLQPILQVYFPETEIKPAWFHFTQFVWHKVNLSHLSAPFNQDDGVRWIVKSLMCLPLLPSETIDQGIEVIKQQILSINFHLKSSKASVLNLVQLINDWWNGTDGPFGLCSSHLAVDYEIEFIYKTLRKKIGNENTSILKFVEKLFEADVLFRKRKIRTKKSHVTSKVKLLNLNLKNLSSEKVDVLGFLDKVSCLVPHHIHVDKLTLSQSWVATEDPSDMPHGAPSLCHIRIDEINPDQ